MRLGPEAPLPDCEQLYLGAAGGLLLTRTDGLILRASQMFCDWLGRTPDDLIGQVRFTKLLTMGGQVFCQTHWTPLLQIQKSVGEVKLEFLHVDGHKVPMIINGVRRRYGEEEFDELFALRILDRHKYEEELLYARRRAEELGEELSAGARNKDEFLATLSHELRNPLAPMRNVVEILARKKIADPQIVWAREVFGRQLDQMQHLVDDLLEASRIAQGKIELRISAVDMAQLIADAAEAVRPTIAHAGHELKVRYPDIPVSFEGDATRITQILVNLLTNAAKFTPSGGVIEISGQRDANMAVFTVINTGIGIETKKLESIFDMFTQIGSASQQGGLGIGLALVRGLARLHGGNVKAESPGLHRGSKFVVRLPLVESIAKQPSAETPAELQHPPELRILIIDDNHDSASSMSMLLQIGGHAVQVANDAKNGLLLAEQGRPDVILLDIGLPDTDGYQVARKIRAFDWGEGVLLVATTGWGQESDISRARAAGFDHHFTKPVDAERLETVLGDYALSLR